MDWVQFPQRDLIYVHDLITREHVVCCLTNYVQHNLMPVLPTSLRLMTYGTIIRKSCSQLIIETSEHPKITRHVQD